MTSSEGLSIVLECFSDPLEGSIAIPRSRNNISEPGAVCAFKGTEIETVNKIKSNITYKAILHLKVQQREVDEEVPDMEGTEEAKDGEQKTKIVTRLEDEDQGGRALSIVTRNAPQL